MLVFWSAAAAAAAALVSVLVVLRTIFRCVRWRQGGSGSAVLSSASGRRRSLGIFHPYCNAGGGGERVLYSAVQALLSQAKEDGRGSWEIVIYAGKSSGSPDEILRRAQQRFGLCVDKGDEVRFVFLRTEALLEASTYPRLTLLGQSLGAMIVGVEALMRFCPDVWLDTMGYSFTYPIARIFAGCKVGCYVHYPTISTDMLDRVYERRPAYNNDELVSGSVVNSTIKYGYYRAFAAVYGLMGWFPSVVMVNSSWTYGHIASLWGNPSRIKVVFPPCEITNEQPSSLQRQRNRNILSVGQFRPEKDHALQLHLMAEFLKRDKDPKTYEDVQLILVGSCRDRSDEERVKSLEKLRDELHLQDRVKFQVNVPFERLQQLQAESLIGLHTMWNEHFGIAVVEMMAAGLITLAHNSGGPRTDIIKHGVTGFLADSAQTYADALVQILNLSNQELETMRRQARESTQRFSEENFRTNFLDNMQAFYYA